MHHETSNTPIKRVHQIQTKGISLYGQLPTEIKLLVCRSFTARDFYDLPRKIALINNLESAQNTNSQNPPRTSCCWTFTEFEMALQDPVFAGFVYHRLDPCNFKFTLVTVNTAVLVYLDDPTITYDKNELDFGALVIQIPPHLQNLSSCNEWIESCGYFKAFPDKLPSQQDTVPLLNYETIVPMANFKKFNHMDSRFFRVFEREEELELFDLIKEFITNESKGIHVDLKSNKEFRLNSYEQIVDRRVSISELMIRREQLFLEILHKFGLEKCTVFQDDHLLVAQRIEQIQAFLTDEDDAFFPILHQGAINQLLIPPNVPTLLKTHCVLPLEHISRILPLRDVLECEKGREYYLQTRVPQYPDLPNICKGVRHIELRFDRPHSEIYLVKDHGFKIVVRNTKRSYYGSQEEYDWNKDEVMNENVFY